MIDAAATYGLSATNDAAQNSEALANAINYAGGETVHISEGIYPIQPLTIHADHTTLQLAPGAILQIEPGARVPAILNIQANHVTVDGGQFDGSSVTGAHGIMAIRIYGSCNDIAIRNCTVRNASTGIGSYNGANCEDWEISGCHIDTTVKGYGIFLHGNPKDTQGIRNVRVLNNTIHNTSSNGIWIGNYFTDVTVVGNQIHDAGRIGIEVWRNHTGNFVIGENLISDCGRFGISIAMTPHTTCSGNLIRRVAGYGIEVADSRSVSLANNHIADVSSKEGWSKPTGISLNSPHNDALGDIAITGGIISGCDTGINVCGDRGRRDHITITGVCIHDCGRGIHNAGIVGKGDGGGMVEHLVISGCVIRAEKTGIGNSVYGGVMSDGAITGNNIQTNGVGISLFRPTEMLVSSNHISGENGDGSIGIQLRDNVYAVQPVHNLLVTDNLITGFETPVEATRIYGSEVQET